MPVGRVLESDRESQSKRQLTARRVLGGDVTGGGDLLRVATNSPAGVGETTVTARGDLTRLSGFDSADVSFDYRQSGTQSWTETPRQTVSETGVFSEDISGLSADTEYEYRARAEAPDGTVVVGGSVVFTTQTAADTSEAQMLAQVGFDASVIERDASVSGSEAQMYDQVHSR